MSAKLNEYGQPIGIEVIDWTPREFPSTPLLVGKYCQLEQLNVEKHANDLFAAYQTATDGRDWTYLPAEPPQNYTTFCDYLTKLVTTSNQYHYAIIDIKTNRALGTIALMRPDTINGSIEVGYVTFSPLLKKTRIATEAQYLLMYYVFDDLQYRRYEWKCDSLNEPSKTAAQRLGFKYEGTFRQAVVYKSRSRDTCWFSIIDKEWGELKGRFEKWLNKENFNQDGTQKNKL
ncbi:GNAT family N-acetyltransferase [Entomomonas sp. E2T0]|uniref:GNAT family N-acetyltransferase n=1 Tax=Entomomonas sp. E2T0 TaxID=2930213 RepID=UPI0022280FB3|nr:GNAT family protein [Entomomonas sp. E2T0]UYZ84688.1 GNAT family N-acetyltransferase [Entomomonas sp. E2T0]